jgi:hypothetical protein
MYSKLSKLIAITAALAMIIVACDSGDDDDSPAPSTFTPAGKVLISSAGQSFTMGSTSGFDDEQPAHAVSFTKDFWIDSTEITQALYDELMSASYAEYTTPTWFPPYGVGATYPAYHVYWDDAVLFCNALSRRDGLDSVYSYTSITGTPGNLCELVGVTSDLSTNGYRLPTEAEWEFACKGNDSRDLYWGRDIEPYPATPADSSEVGQYAVWYANSYEFGADSSAFGAQPVATKLPMRSDSMTWLEISTNGATITMLNMQAAQRPIRSAPRPETFMSCAVEAGAATQSTCVRRTGRSPCLITPITLSVSAPSFPRSKFRAQLSLK